jgi:5-methylcytosine-specific restriction endonuclease McrA
MRKLDVPTITIVEALDACTPHLADPAKIARLITSKQSLIDAEVAYRQKATLGRLFEIKPTDNVNNIVPLAEMSALYTGTFARDGTGSRAIYDSLRNSVAMCPLCGAQQVKTLDHYLPKSTHALFTITPVNLVPACSDCNKEKTATEATGEHDQAIHPYFDYLDEVRWLIATVVQTSPAAVLFMSAPPAGWDQIKAARVIKHFEQLKLGSLFAAQSSDELPALRHRLRRLHNSVGALGVSAHLIEERDDHLKERNNSWQIAMYDALAASHWYCDGGFDA